MFPILDAEFQQRYNVATVGRLLDLQGVSNELERLRTGAAGQEIMSPPLWAASCRQFSLLFPTFVLPNSKHRIFGS